VLVVFTGGGTGGHLYPALAIARALVELRPDVEPFFVGAKRGIERTVLPGTGFPHVLLDLHPLYRTAPWRNWMTVRGLFGSGGQLREALGVARRRDGRVRLIGDARVERVEGVPLRHPGAEQRPWQDEPALQSMGDGSLPRLSRGGDAASRSRDVTFRAHR
jgi:hypothetical protein